MNISCRYFHPKDKAPFITGRVYLVGKLPFMLSLYKHPGIRIGG